LRRRLLITVTNYLGSTQFYLTITHQRILITVLTLALLSLVVGNGVLVWLGTSQRSTLQQSEIWRLAHIKSNDQIQKLQTSVTKLLPPSKRLETHFIATDFQQLLSIAPAAAVSIEQLQSKAKQDHFTIQALERRLTELAHSRYEVSRTLLTYTKKASDLEHSLMQLQGVLGEQVGGEFDLTLVPQMMQTAQQKLTLLTHIPNAWPMAKRAVVTSAYGYRLHPITGTRKMHKGIDLRCAKGTPILATASGVVTSSIKTSGFGNIISLTHSYGFSTRYAHLQKRLVSKAEFVHKGQVIGLCGSTGLSSAPHLHYEVQFLAKQGNPRPFINWNLSNFDGLFQQVKEVQWEYLIKLTQPKSTHPKPTRVKQ
jgi:murein DD-endopeptidase MepM/ murein hydrolase activator NlpD